MNEITACAIIGNAPIPYPWEFPYQNLDLENQIAQVTHQIAMQASTGITHFFTCMNEPIGYWVAMAVMELKQDNPPLRLTGMISNPKQTEQWSEEVCNKYNKQLTNVDDIVCVETSKTANEISAGDRYLADRADFILFFYSDLTAAKNCVRDSAHLFRVAAETDTQQLTGIFPCHFTDKGVGIAIKSNGVFVVAVADRNQFWL